MRSSHHPESYRLRTMDIADTLVASTIKRLSINVKIKE